MEEEIIEQMTDREVLALCREDLATAKKNKIEIDKKIQGWRDLHDGKALGNEVEGRSKFVSAETRKAVSWWVPNAMKPFMGSNDIVEFIPRTADDINNAKSQNVLLNYQFNNNFEKHAFLHSALTLFATEGTTMHV